jgi:CheY-like chemotaxis protein
MSTVLIVDEDQDTRRILRMALEAHGFAVLEAGDATSGLERARLCEMVVLNYPVKFEDGSTLTARLRADSQLNRLPIINLTSHALHDEIERATRDGVDLTLTKPQPLRSIIQALRTALGQSPQVR